MALGTTFNQTPRGRSRKIPARFRLPRPANGGFLAAPQRKKYQPLMGSLKKRRKAKIAKHKRRKRMKENRHKKRLRYKS